MSAKLFTKNATGNKAVSLFISLALALALLPIVPTDTPVAYADDTAAPQANPTAATDTNTTSSMDSAVINPAVSQQTTDKAAVTEDSAVLANSDIPADTPTHTVPPSSPQNIPESPSSKAPPSSPADPTLKLTLLDSFNTELTGSAVIHIGDTITVETESTGVDEALYNYVWVRNNNWSDGNWGSTINTTGSPTSETSWKFTPALPGTYDLYVDLKLSTESTLVTETISIEVLEEWEVESISVPASGDVLHMGDPIQVDISVTGPDADAAHFNYVWARNDNWSAGNWDSTINSSGAPTTDSSWTFTPTRSGSYVIYVDVIRTDGTTTTSQAYNVTVREDWSFEGIELSADTIELSKSVEVTATTTGIDADYARFNYVWNYRGEWNEWSSTELETGEPISDTSWTFTPDRAGEYEIYVDAVRTDGTRVTETAVLTVEAEWGVRGLTITSHGKPLQDATILYGEPLEVTVDMSEGSNLYGLTYNFVWSRNDSWTPGNWDSLANWGLIDTSGTHTYQLNRSGNYKIFVDIIGTDGKSLTLNTPIKVILPFEPTGVALTDPTGEPLVNSTIEVGDSVVISPLGTGDLTKARFNYIWSHEDKWGEGDWNSTINSTGSATSEDSWTFTPSKYGTYIIAVDFVGADGTVQTRTASFTVDRGWTSAGIRIDKTSPQFTGTTLTISSTASGKNFEYVRYNYVWQRDNWADWSSTLKETQNYTSATSFSFMPTHSGDYQFAIDYYDTRTGQSYTETIHFRIDKTWDLQRLDVSHSSPLRPWSVVTYFPIVAGDKSQLKYNFVWQRDNWAEWNSTLKMNGGVYHPYDNGTLTIAGSGWYDFYVDVVDQFGESETVGVTGIHAYSEAEIINAIEAMLANGFDPTGWKYEDALMAAGGTLCNGRRGWWCANYLWWGFTQAGYGHLWGTGSLQADPEYLANEYQSIGRYTSGTVGVQRGDILFSYMAPWRPGQSITHAAYVVSVSGSTVTVIEGNVNSTNYHTYSLWSPMFRGYARPAY